MLFKPSLTFGDTTGARHKQSRSPSATAGDEGMFWHIPASLPSTCGANNEPLISSVWAGLYCLPCPGAESVLYRCAAPVWALLLYGVRCENVRDACTWAALPWNMLACEVYLHDLHGLHMGHTRMWGTLLMCGAGSYMGCAASMWDALMRGVHCSHTACSHMRCTAHVWGRLASGVHHWHAGYAAGTLADVPPRETVTVLRVAMQRCPALGYLQPGKMKNSHLRF